MLQLLPIYKSVVVVETMLYDPGDEKNHVESPLCFNLSLKRLL